MNAFYNIYLLLYYSFRRVHCPFMANLLYVMHAAVVAAAATTAQCSLLLLSIYLVFFCRRLCSFGMRVRNTFTE